MSLNETKWGHKIIQGPFDDCGCPSHNEAAFYPLSDFEKGVAVEMNETLGKRKKMYFEDFGL